jgi:two-component system chemotaxis response regulator CheY
MKRRILTIDDSTVLRQFIHRTLTKQLPDHALSFASFGAEGLGMAGSEKPDLILLDYGLPDIAGDEVCRGLQADPETAGLPVILMGGQARDLKRTQSAFGNVVHTIPKPFTAEQLGATVVKALRDTEEKKTADLDTKPGAVAIDALGAGKDLFFPPPAKPKSKYAPDTTRGTLISVLLDLERDQFTGLMTIIPNQATPIELYLVNGLPCLVTTRDTTVYLACSGLKLTPQQTEAIERLSPAQAQTGNPIFLYFAEEKLMNRRKARTFCQEQNYRLFASLWTASRAKFSFEADAALPSLAKDLLPFEGNMLTWATGSFAMVGQDLTAPRESGKLFSLF